MPAEYAYGLIREGCKQKLSGREMPWTVQINTVTARRKGSNYENQ